MAFPQRLAHLATRQVVAARLAPVFAESHQVEEEEAIEQLVKGLGGTLWESLLSAAWEALCARNPKLAEEALLEKVAKSLKDRPLRLGQPAKSSPGWSALMLWVDLEAGTAGESAQRVLSSDQGRKVAEQGLREAGEHLARELTRK